ncbi:Type IV secretory pathway, VirD2 components (relaxase) [Sphingomonas laterariae]|uniref:Type IV secretory pathway, VirD2 components (Relaxase) n=2 Tax=Edaphosphingomonas laterariae TaxID=861865 RepID=A0A239I4X3_9SPHN|nr:Type IV secretory pathway, VirD2 components (relaxase) [Sphingomonas laterariae]
MDDDGFEPRLGRARQQQARGRRTFLGSVVMQANRMASDKAGAKRFGGSQFARGAATGKLLGRRGRRLGSDARRVVIKTRLIRLTPRTIAGAAAHMRYLERDGVTREGERGQFYAAATDLADGKEFLARSASDRHQFRFIVGAEDGDRLADLKPIVRRLMTQMEKDLDTRLDWIAVDHFDTGHPHSHVILRGRDDQERDLVIAPTYIKSGMRERARDILTAELGPRTTLEIADRLGREIDAEWFTEIDRTLVAGKDMAGMVRPHAADPIEHALEVARLRRLARLGLATRMGQDHWRLTPHLEATLRRMGEQGDIIRTMQRAMTAHGLDRGGSPADVHDALTAPVTGQVIERGLADEHGDRHYLIIDGLDGRLHHVPIGRANAVEPLPPGAIVRVSPSLAAVRDADRTIAAVAGVNQGWYDEEAHRHFDPRASSGFIDAHVRRLEALRRTAGLVERDPSGRWAIASDHLARVSAHERSRVREAPVTVEILSTLPLERLPSANAATWLDRRLIGEDIEPARETGFGREVERATVARRQWLFDAGLAWTDGDQMGLKADLIAILRRRELLRVAGQLSEELGLPFAEVCPGERITGRLGRPVDLACTRVVTVERAHDFTLVPWRHALARHLGKSGSGILREDGISWSSGRERSGPEVG